MGQEASSATGESRTVPGRPGKSKFLQESLAECDASGVLDRFDLATYLTHKQFEDTVKAEHESATWKIFVDSKANVWVRRPGDRSDLPEGSATECHTLDLPALADDYAPRAHGLKPRYIVRASCKENPNVPPLAKPCDSESAIVDLLCEVLRLGAESLDVTIGQEMLVIDFDKGALMEDYESRNAGSAGKKGLQVITSFAWLVIDTCRLVPAQDPLKTCIARMKAGRGTKSTLVKELRKNGTEEVLCRLFLAATGPGPAGDQKSTVAEQYLTVMMQTAKDRQFEMTGAGTKGELLLLHECVSEMVERVQDMGKDVKEWELCVRSEAVHVQTAGDAMVQAERSKAVGKNDDYVRYAMRAASFACQELQAFELKRVNDPGAKLQPSLSSKHQESMISAGKALVDTMLASLESGSMVRESFERKFSELCDTMVALCNQEYADYMKLELKKLPREQLIHCLRQKADYLRYLFLYVPSRRRGEQLIRETYEEAIEHASYLPPRKLAGTSAFVNYAMFHAEVRRDSMEASRVLTAGMSCMDRRQPPSAAEAAQVCNPSEVLTWKLMLSNSEAFQSRVLILQICFHVDCWKVHAAAEETAAVDQEEAQAALHDVSSTKAPSAGGTVLRGMEAWNAAQMNPKRLSIDPQAAGRKNVQSTKDIQRVVRWVRSRPLCRNTLVPKDEDAPEDLLHQVRWIEHVELPPEHEDLTNDDDASNATRYFLVGCAVRLSESAMANRRNPDAWSEQFVDELRTDESERHASVQPKEIVVPSQAVLHAITDILDAEGVVQSSKDIQGVRLSSGDILGHPQDMRDMELKEVVKIWRSTDAPISYPKTVHFLPCLQVFDLRVVEAGPYTDVHTHFTGFPGGDAVDGKLLRRSPRFTSLAGIITDLRMIHPRLMRGQNARPTPRRIPGMSARRSPFQASKRGCK